MSLFSDDSDWCSAIFGSKQGFFSNSQDTTVRNITVGVVACVAAALLIVYAPAVFLISLLIAAAASAVAIALNPEEASKSLNRFKN